MSKPTMVRTQIRPPKHDKIVTGVRNGENYRDFRQARLDGAIPGCMKGNADIQIDILHP